MSTDTHVTRRIWLPIDIDPLRPSGVSATKEERKLTQDVGNTLMQKLEEIGFPETCIVGGTSGNGYHILIRIDLPADDESRDLVKRCLAAMQGLVGTGKVEVDPKVYNAARIIKAYGTLSRKGVNIPERPWRGSKLTIVPARITVADKALLEKLAAMAPEKNPRRDTGEKRQGPWNLENTQAYLKWTGWHGKQQAAAGKPGETAKWVGSCINDDNHKDAAVILHDDGWWSYGCFHSSCSDVRHKEFMAHWEEANGEKYPYPGHHRSSEFDDADFLGQFAQSESKAFHLTDAGNMERLVHKYGHLFRYCPQRDWYGWDGKRWVPDSEGKIYQAALRTVREIEDELPLHLEAAEDDKERAAITKSVLDWALASESKNHLAAMEFLTRSAEGIAVNIREFDTEPWIFNCANGTRDLRTNDFRPHEQADMITNISQALYDPKAECPLWESFLSDVMAGDREMMGFLQRAAGYSLTGSTAQHCMFICWGTGRNGKSTFLEVLRHVIGTYSKQASMTTFLAKKSDEGIPNDLAALQGARFVTGIETEDGKRLAEAKIKLITGGDTVTARFLHREFFEFEPQFKIWMATNYRPVIHGTDEGIWRRIRLIPFTVYIPDGKMDEKLREKLISESGGILNWALAGLEEYKLGGLMEPDGVIKATEDYRAAEDWLGRFMDSETIQDPNATTQARMLYERYKSWTKDTNEFVMKERRFNEAMDDHQYGHTKRDNKKLYAGFRLRDPMEKFREKYGGNDTVPDDMDVF